MIDLVDLDINVVDVFSEYFAEKQNAPRWTPYKEQSVLMRAVRSVFYGEGYPLTLHGLRGLLF